MGDQTSTAQSIVHSGDSVPAAVVQRGSSVRSTESWERSEAELITQLETMKLALKEVYDELGERDRLRPQLEDARQELQAVYASLSWRVAAPLRAVSARFPGLSGRPRALARRYPKLLSVLSRADRLARRVLRTLVGSSTAVPAMIKTGSISLRPIEVRANAGVSQRLPRGSGKRVLCVGHVMPFPPRAGNEYRIHRMLSWLSDEGFDVLVIVCPLRNEMPSELQIARAAAIYPQFIVCGHDGIVRHNLPKDSAILSGMSGTRVREFATLLEEENGKDQRADELLGVLRTFCPDVLIETLLHIEQNFKPRTLLAEYVFMTRAMTLLRADLHKIVDTIDVFSSKAHKVERYGVTDGLAMSETEEAMLMARADVLIGIQPAESQEIERLAPTRKVVTVGVDFDVKESVLALPPKPVVLLVASGNPMNVKGLQDFLRYSWPFVRREVPQAELRVVGDVGASVDFAPEGVHILGRVESLDDAYADARVVINPTIAGTGLKIKTVEALSHLRPVVTFPAGVDGVAEAALSYCRVATDWYAFACEVAHVLSAPQDATQLERRSRVLVDCFSAKAVYAPLKRVLDEI